MRRAELGAAVSPIRSNERVRDADVPQAENGGQDAREWIVVDVDAAEADAVPGVEAAASRPRRAARRGRAGR